MPLVVATADVAAAAVVLCCCCAAAVAALCVCAAVVVVVIILVATVVAAHCYCWLLLMLLLLLAAAVVAAATVAVAAAPLSLQLSLSLSFGVHAVRTFLTSRASRASRPRALAPCPSSILSKKPRASSFRALCLRDPSFIVSSNAFVRCRLLGGRALSRPSLAVPYHRLLPHRSLVVPPSGATMKAPGCQGLWPSVCKCDYCSLFWVVGGRLASP